jgi:hypothetical protein
MVGKMPAEPLPGLAARLPAPAAGRAQWPRRAPVRAFGLQRRRSITETDSALEEAGLELLVPLRGLVPIALSKMTGNRAVGRAGRPSAGADKPDGCAGSGAGEGDGGR